LWGFIFVFVFFVFLFGVFGVVVLAFVWFGFFGFLGVFWGGGCFFFVFWFWFFVLRRNRVFSVGKKKGTGRGTIFIVYISKKILVQVSRIASPDGGFNVYCFFKGIKGQGVFLEKPLEITRGCKARGEKSLINDHATPEWESAGTKGSS